MLQEISRLLATIEAPGSFATRRTATTADLRLDVKGVGRIRLPIAKATAVKLCAVARPARHGLKDETRLDRRVRDTWEIPRSRIAIDRRAWSRTLLPHLDRIRRDLGLGEDCRLRAELHNMLVYEPGQFFLTHQDSEKTDDMIGTLVVILPSDSTGGAMVIEHHGETVVFRGARGKLAFIAFYADCHHEVRPITRGHRVVLTYNLRIEGAAAGAVSPSGRIDVLARSVRALFDAPRLPSWRGQPPREPVDRLVFLLDHQYTRRGLAWGRLKNADAARAAALREVARQLDCEIFLALADVHETWNYEEETGGFGRYEYGGRWERYDEEDEEEEEGDDDGFDGLTLTDLLDSEVELRHWIGSDGGAEGIASAVDADELCYTKPSADLEPFASEHEGYMGNYGNTVERWYHRAAVVLWPRERTFVIRARASALWAIAEVADALKAGKDEEARRMAQRLLPFWTQATRREDGTRFFDRTLRVVTALDSPDLAAALLEPFTLTRLTPGMAPRLVALLDRYGLEWCRARLGQWASGNRLTAAEPRAGWLASALPDLCRPLSAADAPHGLALARWLVAEQWAWLVAEWQQRSKQFDPKRTLEALTGLNKPIVSLIDACLVTSSPDLQGQIVAFLISAGSDAPIRALTHFLRTAHESYPRKALHALGLEPVHAHSARDLTTRLNTPARAKDDWSIQVPTRCACKLCVTLARFLRAPDQVRLEWPLAKDHRAHVHQIVDAHGLPVSHVTRRTGRPFTLVLAKTEAVFQRDEAERRFWQSELSWLTRTANAF